MLHPFEKPRMEQGPAVAYVPKHDPRGSNNKVSLVCLLQEERRENATSGKIKPTALEKEERHTQKKKPSIFFCVPLSPRCWRREGSSWRCWCAASGGPWAAAWAPEPGSSRPAWAAAQRWRREGRAGAQTPALRRVLVLVLPPADGPCDGGEVEAEELPRAEPRRPPRAGGPGARATSRHRTACSGPSPPPEERQEQEPPQKTAARRRRMRRERNRLAKEQHPREQALGRISARKTRRLATRRRRRRPAAAPWLRLGTSRASLVRCRSPLFRSRTAAAGAAQPWWGEG